jgi:hypothetical protein
MQNLPFLGTPVYLNGRDYYIPSLSYKALRANYALLTEDTSDLEGDKMFEYFEKRIPVIGLAIRRNYPEVTDEDLDNWLDLTTLPLAIQAVASRSGVKALPAGE